MTSRDRVRKVLQHEIPDRVPNGLGGCECTGIHIYSYDLIQKIFNIPRQAPRINSFMATSVFENELIEAMEGDVLLVASPLFCDVPLWGKKSLNQWKEQEIWGKTFQVPVNEQLETQKDGSILWKNRNLVCPNNGFFFDEHGSSDFLADFDYPDPENYTPPDSFTDEYLRELEELTKGLYEETEYSLCLGETVEGLQFKPCGRIGWLILVKENPELMKAYLEKACTASLKQIALIDQAVGKYVDMMVYSNDMGDNRGLLLGEQTWREIYKPIYKRFFQGWHNRTNIKINLHSCGSIYTILDDLIECGVDVYNPVQISVCNMEPERLKTKFGKHLVFYGGDYDAQMMKGCKYDDVYEHVKTNLNILKKDGGHIFCGVHNLPPDMSEEHLRAFFSAWMDHRNY